MPFLYLCVYMSNFFSSQLQFFKTLCTISFLNKIISLSLAFHYYDFIRTENWDFLGHPVVKTLCFNCRAHGFPGQGIKILHAIPYGMANIYIYIYIYIY